MCHWKSIPYRKIENFLDFYYEDKTNSAYYSDWDSILKYQSALGFGGIEQLFQHVVDLEGELLHPGQLGRGGPTE